MSSLGYGENIEQPKHEPALASRLREAFSSSTHLNDSVLTVEEVARYTPPPLINDELVKDGHAVLLPLTFEAIDGLGMQFPPEQRGRFRDLYIQTYDIRCGFPKCYFLESTIFPAIPGSNCWTEDVSPKKIASERRT
jgi:hypothetical protein